MLRGCKGRNKHREEEGDIAGIPQEQWHHSACDCRLLVTCQYMSVFNSMHRRINVTYYVDYLQNKLDKPTADI